MPEKVVPFAILEEKRQASTVRSIDFFLRARRRSYERCRSLLAGIDGGLQGVNATLQSLDLIRHSLRHSLTADE